MKTRTIGSGQGGFTLIEVIAVLVIVGMLAAVAIPRYLDMQDSAAAGAVQGALAAGASNVTMVYSTLLVNGTYTLAALNTALNAAPYTNVGDFGLAYATNGTTGIEITVANSSVNSINTRLSNLTANNLTKKTVALQ